MYNINNYRSDNWLLYKLGGFVLFLLSFVVLLSFMGYYFAYSGWYHYSENDLQHYLSTIGFYLSDLTMAYLGPITTLTVAFILFCWGLIMIVYHKPVSLCQCWYLLLLMISTSALGSSLQALLTWHFPLGWGGYLGDNAHDIIIWIRDIMGFRYLFVWEKNILGVVSTIFAYKTLNIDVIMLNDIGRFVFNRIRVMVDLSKLIFVFIYGILFQIWKGIILIYNILWELSNKLRGYFKSNDIISSTNLIDSTMSLSQSVACIEPTSSPLKLTNSHNQIDSLPLIQNKADYEYSDIDFTILPDNLLSSQLTSEPITTVSKYKIAETSKLLIQTLHEFGVDGKIASVAIGPIVMVYGFKPGPGVKVSKIQSLEQDLARVLSCGSVRIGIMENTDTVGIEVPYQYGCIIPAADLYNDKLFRLDGPALTLALGKKVNGELMFVDLAKMPHLLVAGTTGSGKSVAINTMIVSLVSRLAPNQCRLILIDPKQLEFSLYDGIPYLLMPVITEAKKAVLSLKWVVSEMERRYDKMSAVGVRSIINYNALAKKCGTRVQVGFDMHNNKPLYRNFLEDITSMPYIVVVIDELADLMATAGREIEILIQKLAQMARAAGIHLILSTQRPSVDVITGTIKANFPVRISFQVSSGIDSKTILGVQGAETLLGNGDMLLLQSNCKITRVHGCFISDSDIKKVVSHIKYNNLPNKYVDLEAQN